MLGVELGVVLGPKLSQGQGQVLNQDQRPELSQTQRHVTDWGLEMFQDEELQLYLVWVRSCSRWMGGTPDPLENMQRGGNTGPLGQQWWQQRHGDGCCQQ